MSKRLHVAVWVFFGLGLAAEPLQEAWRAEHRPVVEAAPSVQPPQRRPVGVGSVSKVYFRGCASAPGAR